MMCWGDKNVNDGNCGGGYRVAVLVVMVIMVMMLIVIIVVIMVAVMMPVMLTGLVGW